MAVLTRPKTRRTREPVTSARTHRGRGRYLIGAMCLAICTVMLLPLVMSTLASVKPTAEAAASPPTYFPHSISLDSYHRLWSYQQGLPTYLANSLGAALLTIAFTLLLTVPAAYSLARFPLPGKEFIFIVLLLALIVPYQALLTPMFLMFAKVKLTNSLVGLAILHTAIQLPFSLYILRNSFSAVPRELEEAATVDGAGSFGVFRHVILPLSKPVIAVTAFFGFLAGWTEFYFSWAFLQAPKDWTLAMALNGMVGQYAANTKWSEFAAFAILVAVPVAVVYLFLQRYIISGLTVGGVKG